MGDGEGPRLSFGAGGGRSPRRRDIRLPNWWLRLSVPALVLGGAAFVQRWQSDGDGSALLWLLGVGLVVAAAALVVGVVGAMRSR